MLLTLLAACVDIEPSVPVISGTSPSTPMTSTPTLVPPSTETDLPRPSDLEPGEPPVSGVPQLDGDALIEAMAAQLDALAGVDMVEIIAVSEGLFDLRSNNCPETVDTYFDAEVTSLSMSTYGCFTNDNTWFDGDFTIILSETPYGSGRLETLQVYSNGGFEVDTATGERFELAGYMGAAQYAEPSYEYSYLYAAIVGASSPSMTSNPLLLGDISGDFYIDVFSQGAYRSMYMDGSASIDAPGVTALSSTGVGIDEGCDPGGIVSLREEGEAWQSLVFDPYDDSCDACATYGEVTDPATPTCFDQGTFDALLQWEQMPWSW